MQDEMLFPRQSQHTLAVEVGWHPNLSQEALEGTL